MSTRIRSSSVGAAPQPKIHHPSRNLSVSTAPLEVRCGCQFFKSESPPAARATHMSQSPVPRIDYYAETSSPSRSRPVSRLSNNLDDDSLNNEPINKKPVKISRSDIIGGVPRSTFPTSRDTSLNKIHSIQNNENNLIQQNILKDTSNNAPEQVTPQNAPRKVNIERLSRFDQYKMFKKG